MRWLPLFLCGTLCFGAPAKKPSQPDKVHLSLTYSERNGLAFPSAGGIGLVTAPLLGGAALASALGGIGNLGGTLNDLFSGKDAGIPKTGGEMERMMSSPQGDALVALASRLPLSCSYRAQLEADLVWDVSKRAYLVSSGTLTWTGRNNSRFESKGLLLYCNLSGGGSHRLTRDEVMVKFSNGDLSKALAAKGKQETLTYELILDVKPKEEAITGDAGYLSQAEGHVVYQTQDRFTTAGQMTNVNVIDGYLKENVKAEPLMFAKNLAYQAEEREIRDGNADFSETWMAPGGTQTAIRWTFNPPKDEEMVFVVKEDYEKWIPAPRPEDMPGIALSSTEDAWKPLEVKVKIRTKREGGTPRKGKIRFTLEEVSKNAGFCINYPINGKSKMDLRFAKEQPPGITLKGAQATAGGTIVDAAETDKKVLEASVILESTDPGAYGKLKAACAELDLKALHEPTNTYALSIPRDDDSNHIADAWERKLGLPHRDRDWDGEVVAAQDKKGDGITLYNEYRGLVLLEGEARTWKRLDPAQKEMFVLDPSQDFPIAVWKRISSLQVYRVDESMVDASSNAGRSPLVNANSSDSGAHPFYALKIRKIGGDEDPDPARDGDTIQPKTTTDPSFPLMAYAFSPSPGIKGTEYIKVFPQRAWTFVTHYTNWLETGLKDPDSQPGRELREPRNQFSIGDATQALAVLRTPAGQKEVIRKVLNVLFLHESGHVVAELEHHTGDAPNDEIRSCLMFVRGISGQRRMVVLSAIGRGDPDFAYPYSSFCHTGAGCSTKLNVKDW